MHVAGHSEAILCVQFSPDGRQLASGAGDCTVRFWDLNTQTPLLECKVWPADVACQSLEPHGASHFMPGLLDDTSCALEVAVRVELPREWRNKVLHCLTRGPCQISSIESITCITCLCMWPVMASCEWEYSPRSHTQYRRMLWKWVYCGNIVGIRVGMSRELQGRIQKF